MNTTVLQASRVDPTEPERPLDPKVATLADIAAVAETIELTPGEQIELDELTNLGDQL